VDWDDSFLEVRLQTSIVGFVGLQVDLDKRSLST